MREVTPADVLTAQYSTLARAGVSAAAAQTWNPQLNRTSADPGADGRAGPRRPAGASEPDAQVLSQLPDPAPDASGGPARSAQDPAVHRRDAPRSGRLPALGRRATGSPRRRPRRRAPRRRRAACPRSRCADRWLVVRLAGGTPRRTRAWVVEAERGRTVDLASWSEASGASGGRTPNFPSEKLTATAGGDPAWAAVYDTAEDRFGMHDPLDDLTAADLEGTVSYLVCGWWSKDANDPLYAAARPTGPAGSRRLNWSYTPSGTRRPGRTGPRGAARRPARARHGRWPGHALGRHLGRAAASQAEATRRRPWPGWPVRWSRAAARRCPSSRCCTAA